MNRPGISVRRTGTGLSKSGQAVVMRKALTPSLIHEIGASCNLVSAARAGSCTIRVLWSHTNVVFHLQHSSRIASTLRKLDHQRIVNCADGISLQVLALRVVELRRDRLIAFLQDLRNMRSVDGQRMAVSSIPGNEYALDEKQACPSSEAIYQLDQAMVQDMVLVGWRRKNIRHLRQ